MERADIPENNIPGFWSFHRHRARPVHPSDDEPRLPLRPLSTHTIHTQTSFTLSAFCTKAEILRSFIPFERLLHTFYTALTKIAHIRTSQNPSHPLFPHSKRRKPHTLYDPESTTMPKRPNDPRNEQTSHISATALVAVFGGGGGGDVREQHE